MQEVSQQSKEKLKGAIDELSAAFFVTDVEATILYANPAVEKSTGYSVREVVGKNPGRLWGGHMKRNFYEKMWRTIEGARRPFVGEVLNAKKGGVAHHDNICVAPVKNEAGTIEFFIGMHPDIVGNAASEQFRKEFKGVMAQDHLKTQDFLSLMEDVSRSHIDTCIPNAELDAIVKECLVEPTKSFFYRREDDKLLILAAKEDSSAFGQLYDRYYKQVYEYFFHRLSNNADSAEDMTQETFLRAFKYLPQFELSNASYLTYLLRVAHNLLVNQYRMKTEPALDELGEIKSDEDRQLYNYVVQNELFDALDALSAVECQIVTMKYRDEMSVKEIADALGKSENAVKLHLSRGRQHLRKNLGISVI